MFKSLLFFAVILVSILLSSCSSKPYGQPPETSDPWELIHYARKWIDAGRPRGAMPSLKKAFEENEKRDRNTKHYLDTKAAIYNEMGRVYYMVSDISSAEHYFNEAYKISLALGYRALQFDINYNLSGIYVRKNDPRKACDHLAKVVGLYNDLNNNPSDPPDGFGVKHTKEVLEDFARQKINDRSKEMNCGIYIH